MPARHGSGVSRRRFLTNAVGAAGVLPLTAVSLTASSDTAHPRAAARGAANGYRALSPRDAEIVEALVTALCPADAATDDVVRSGLAAFIDGFLAGDIEVPASGHPQLLRDGLSALDAFSRARLNASFHRLSAADAARLLACVRSGDGDDVFPLSAWNAEVLEPVLRQACFAGPIYDAYGSRMFVKLFG